MALMKHKTRQQRVEEHRKELAPAIEDIKKLHTKYGRRWMPACNRYIAGLREKRKAEFAIKKAEAELTALRQSLGKF